uniref:Uncharacterized protein n=1 Tax=Noctiluca scintillans TaxID=2966 RepID=A0A7S1FAM0_NOCSC|eukprot:CAMPEP_0194519538 /NCGR_PEP_ID=MMETSP0253-20130528/53197_1 /TAXON_ID=2966 /ORGANISM="Noctiluca scintillans" /LENGTH=198 /DNA_ID=CAMNT_0039363687 /DNA_START=23 /DNA_END=619 /DNA_ORIENTATION=-
MECPVPRLSPSPPDCSRAFAASSEYVRWCGELRANALAKADTIVMDQLHRVQVWTWLAAVARTRATREDSSLGAPRLPCGVFRRIGEALGCEFGGVPLSSTHARSMTAYARKRQWDELVSEMQNKIETKVTEAASWGMDELTVWIRAPSGTSLAYDDIIAKIPLWVTDNMIRDYFVKNGFEATFRLQHPGFVSLTLQW